MGDPCVRVGRQVRLSCASTGKGRDQMRRYPGLAGCLLVGIAGVFALATRSSTALVGDPAAATVRSAGGDQQFSHLPLAFELNRGQVDPQVKYVARAASFSAYLTSSGVIVGLHSQVDNPRTRRDSTPAPAPAPVAMQFI